MKVKVCLINPPDTIVEDPLWDEPLGLLYLGAVLEKEGISVEVVDLNFHKDWGKELSRHDADVYGIYCASSLLSSTLKVRDFLKTNFPYSKLIVGGPHATCMPESLVPYFDVVVKGEGEQTILDVVKDYQHVRGPSHARNLPSIYVGRTVENLDSLPFPARHLAPIHKYHRKVGGEHSVGVITARGCPNNCAFCSKVWGKTVRFRSAENVVAEVKEVVGKYGIKGLSFRDDTFTLNKSRLLKILYGLQCLDVKWRCITRVDQVDENTLMAMKNAGCVEIVYGTESGSQKILDNLRKGTTVEQNAKAITLTKQAGIPCKAAFIVGSPGETWGTVNETLRFVEEHAPDKAILCTFTPYPGSPVWENPDEFNMKILTRDVTKYQVVGPGMEGNVVVETEEMTAKDIAEAHDMMLSRFKELGIVD